MADAAEEAATPRLAWLLGLGGLPRSTGSGTRSSCSCSTGWRPPSWRSQRWCA